MPVSHDRNVDTVYGRHPVLELLRSQTPVHRVLVAEGSAMTGALGEIRRRAEAAAVPVKVVPKARLDQEVDGNHQGVVAEVGRYRYAALEDLLERPRPALLFLDGVTDPHNLGSLLRSAEGAGFTGVVLPTRRSVAVTPAVRRVAAGAADLVSVARVTNLGQALDRAKKKRLWVVGLDADARQPLWTSDLLEPPVAVVLGAEDRGMSRVVRERCDEVVRIPLSGRIQSLNVAVAGAIVMFEVDRRRGRSATL